MSALAAVARGLASSPSPPAGPLRVCVVGAGSISREFALHHFGASTATVVRAVVDVDLERARQLAVDVGSVQAGAAVADSGGSRYRAVAAEVRGEAVSHASALSSAVLDGVDCVYVGTTPAAHAPLVLAALAAGKHVLLEKPLAATAADADAIVAAAEEAQSRRGLVVGMNIGMRWNPALHELRRRLALGGGAECALGDLVRAELRMHYRRWPREWQRQPWCAARAEGGPLREVGTHFFFGLMELFGHGCVRRVRCTVTYPDGPGGSAAESSAEGVMELRSGLLVGLSMRTDLAAATKDVYELEVEGTTGETLVLEDFARLRRTRPVREWVVEDGSYGRVECVTALTQAAAAAAAAAAAVARPGGGTVVAIDPAAEEEEEAGGGSGGGVSVRQGRNAQRLLDALLESGGEWVEVLYD